MLPMLDQIKSADGSRLEGEATTMPSPWGRQLVGILSLQQVRVAQPHGNVVYRERPSDSSCHR
jgi:hypothetical protein